MSEGIDLDRIPNKLIDEFLLDKQSKFEGSNFLLVDRTAIEDIIRKAYTEGLTLGLASAHDKMVYRAVVDYIVPEHKGEFNE